MNNQTSYSRVVTEIVDLVDGNRPFLTFPGVGRENICGQLVLLSTLVSNGRSVQIPNCFVVQRMIFNI